jgi:ArsR family transcriptional regulator
MVETIKKRTVLFLCTGNSARSQMAEALLKHKAGDLFDVYSSGTQPDTIDPRTIEALRKFGLDADYLVSKHINTFAGRAFDYVITLCDKANNECRSYPNAGKQLAWDFPDPKTRSGNHPFSTTLSEINNRISMFLQVEVSIEESSANDQSGAEIKAKNSSLKNSTEQLTDFDPIGFYKTLTDDIRLKTLMLTHYHGELCVCELMEAMDVNSQPKISRNLALLKKAQVLTDRKHGQWVFYRINPELPLWAKSVIAQTTENNIPLIETKLQRLADMQNRPDRASFCK